METFNTLTTILGISVLLALMLFYFVAYFYLQELLHPVIKLGNFLVTLASWDDPMKSFVFCCASFYIILRFDLLTSYMHKLGARYY